MLIYTIMKILEDRHVRQKVKRLAYQIVENNLDYPKIFLLGINNNGMLFADLLKKELDLIGEIEVITGQIRLNPANPLEGEVSMSVSHDEIQDQSILITDDVANTGRTLFYAFSAVMEGLPKRVQAGVLVDRKHKNFPVKVDYVGLSLATTLKENIEVNIESAGNFSVHLN